MPIQLARFRRSGLLWSIVGGGLVACGSSTDVRTTAPATPQAAAIRFDSALVKVTIGANRQLVAIVTDATGAVLAGQDIRWNSINPSVVSVSPTGVVHGIVPGSALVTAIIGSHVAIDTVTVVAPPASRRPRFGIQLN